MTDRYRTALVDSTTLPSFGFNYRQVTASCLNYDLIGLKVAYDCGGRASGHPEWNYDRSDYN
jgi:hypothetical protein